MNGGEFRWRWNIQRERIWRERASERARAAGSCSWDRRAEKKTERRRINNVDICGVSSIMWPRRSISSNAMSKARRWRAESRAAFPPPRPLSGDHEGAAGLRYALLAGLSVPQGADRAAAPEGGVPEAQDGRLHQPLQEGHARSLRLRQRHWVLQQRRRMARVR